MGAAGDLFMILGSRGKTEPFAPEPLAQQLIRIVKGVVAAGVERRGDDLITGIVAATSPQHLPSNSPGCPGFSFIRGRCFGYDLFSR